VSQTLHTTTPSIFAPLLRHHLSCDAPEESFTVLRRLLTALVHHCKSAEQFSPLSDLLTESLVSAPRENYEQLNRLLEVITVSCSVRQGSRMSGMQIYALKLLAHILISRISSEAPCHPPLSIRIHPPYGFAPRLTPEVHCRLSYRRRYGSLDGTWS
jgi:hypothetical protein